MRLCLAASAALFLASSSALAQGPVGQTPHLMRAPSLSDTEVAFRYADDIWLVSRTGGTARRLTSTANVEDGPYFSPDGRTIAYAARTGGNTDLYTVPGCRTASPFTRRATTFPAGRPMDATC